MKRPLPYVAIDWQRTCFEECETAGWDPERKLSFAEEITHLHEEVTEIFKAWRERHDFEITYRAIDGKPEGVPIEMAACSSDCSTTRNFTALNYSRRFALNTSGISHAVIQPRDGNFIVYRPSMTVGFVILIEV
jgi:hypothetical protein